MTGAADNELQSSFDSGWFLPCTRRDATAMLSAGLVMPSVGLARPETALLEAAPGHLLLVRDVSRIDWYGSVTDASENFPVLLELAVDLDEVGRETMPAWGDAVAAVPRQYSAVPCAVYIAERPST